MKKLRFVFKAKGRISTGERKKWSEAESIKAIINVVGANPHLTFEAFREGKKLDEPAYADGTDTIEVKPKLKLFNIPYQGGLEIVDSVSDLNNSRDLEDYFEASKKEFQVHEELSPGSNG